VSVVELYEASPVKRPPRQRATQAEMEERARWFINYAAKHGPVTVRQLYYRAVVEGITGIEKTDSGYAKVQRQLLNLRRAKRLSYEYIADATRWMRKPHTWDSVQEALHETARLYRKSLWQDADSYVEIWVEKDALAGVIYPVTSEYDVPLMVARGFASETFCFEAIESREDDDRPYHLYYFGDFDRAGRDAANALQEKLERFAAEKGVEVQFTQLAINESQIGLFNERLGSALVWLNGTVRELPTREPKRKSSADKQWPYDFCIELDAIEPDDLRDLVRSAIEKHLPADQLKILKIAEASERDLIQELVRRAA